MSSTKVYSATEPIARLILTGSTLIKLDKLREILNELFRDPEQPTRQIIGNIIREESVLYAEAIASSDTFDDILQTIEEDGLFVVWIGSNESITIRVETPKEMAEWYENTRNELRHRHLNKWTKNPAFIYEGVSPSYVKWNRADEDWYQEATELIKRVVSKTSFEPRLKYFMFTRDRDTGKNIDIYPNHHKTSTRTLLSELRENRPPQHIDLILAEDQIEETKRFIFCATHQTIGDKPTATDLRGFLLSSWAAIFEWGDLETMSLVQAYPELACKGE
jgi:hypothetical protein